MRLHDQFRYCPRCASPHLRRTSAGAFECAACEFLFFLNTATAVAALLIDSGGRILLIERARNPGRGKLALPGGFVEAGEAAEQALIREVEEELGIAVVEPVYHASYVNQYEYRAVSYDVLDLFYTCHIGEMAPSPDRAEVAAWRWFEPASIDLDTIAFPSNALAIALYRRRL